MAINQASSAPAPLQLSITVGCLLPAPAPAAAELSAQVLQQSSMVWYGMVGAAGSRDRWLS